jgi:hypothetical protein
MEGGMLLVVGGGGWGGGGNCGWGNQGYLMSFPHKHNCGKQLVQPRSCTGYTLYLHGTWRYTTHLATYNSLLNVQYSILDLLENLEKLYFDRKVTKIMSTLFFSVVEEYTKRIFFVC